MQIAILAVLGLASIVIGFIIQLILPDIKLIGWILMALGVILLASSFILEFRRVRRVMGSRRGKFGTSTSIMVSAFIGIIIFANGIGTSFYSTVDFSGLGQFTLTQQTRDVLANLETPIVAKCFLVPSVTNIDESYQQYYAIARNYAPALLSEYANYTNKLTIRVIDPEQHPEEARKYNITSEYLYQSVVFEPADESSYMLVTAPEIYTQAEDSFTSAILQVTGVKQKKIYFLAGHGEADPEDTGNSGYDSAREALRQNLFLVYTLDLVATPSIPDDCAVLVVAGPYEPMNDNERQIIDDYLKKGGMAVFESNPKSPDDIAKLMADWGITVKNGTIIDTSANTAPNLDWPTVTRDRNNYGMTSLYFPGATAIEPEINIPDGMEAVGLAWTTQNSWMEENYDPLKTPTYDEDVDLAGPLFISLIVRPSAPTDANTPMLNGPTIAIIGDSDYANNKNFFNGNNGDFFTTTVNYLATGSELISIERKVLTTRRLILTPEKARFLIYSSIGMLPIIVLAIGIVIWFRRR